jgi:hypothetical protein
MKFFGLTKFNTKFFTPLKMGESLFLENRFEFEEIGLFLAHCPTFLLSLLYRFLLLFVQTADRQTSTVWSQCGPTASSRR